MIAQIGRILLRFILSVAVASVLIFIALRIVPGDPAEVALGVTATPELLAETRAQYGLDQPLITQYAAWIGGLLHGDFGTSLTSGTPISPLVTDRFAVSLILILTSMVLAVLVAVPLGVWAGMRARHTDGAVISAATQLGIALPSFLVGILLVTVFSVQLGWLPANGWTPPAWGFGSFLSRLIMPVLALAAVQAAILTRYVRSAVLDILGEDFLITARAGGLTRWQALIRHGLRNAAIPVVTVTGIQLAGLIIGAVVVERVFVVPGLGNYLLDAVAARDLPTVQTVVLVLVVFTLLINMIVDISYALIDPRVRR
ncbi:MAG: ABC transporter permease [Corynebacterium sp.]|nr:ABC transporter permease [Corynebacterium sp.]